MTAFESPRYLLREEIFREYLEREEKKPFFLEIGFGQGHLIKFLASKGFHGHAFEKSSTMNSKLNNWLKNKSINSIEVLTDRSQLESYDLILLMEVVGYFQDPLGELKELCSHLSSGGRLIFSFVSDQAQFHGDHTGTHKMSRQQATKLIDELGLKTVEIRSYGFPWTLISEPLFNLYLSAQTSEKESAQQHPVVLAGLLKLFLNRRTMRPLFHIQKWASRLELGNGYVAIAEKPHQQREKHVTGN